MHRLWLLKIRNPNNSCEKFPNSLFFAEKFPVHCKKFPVPLRREFCRKLLNLLADWARKSAREVGFLQNSLFFSLLAGNLRVETGSILAASTTTHSRANQGFRRFVKEPPFGGVR